MHQRYFSALLVFGLACFLPAGVRAACPESAPAPVTVENNGAAHETVNIGPNAVAQTFIAPGTGCLQIQSVQLWVRGVNPTGALVASVYLTDGTGTPTTQIGSVATIALFASATIDSHTATFSTPVQIVGGQRYAIVFSQPDWTGGNHYYEAKTVQNSSGGYPGGAVWNKAVDATNWATQANRDIPMTIAFICCTSVSGCVHSQGFWKTHYPAFWPSFATMGLGTVSYSQAQLSDIFGLPVGAKSVGGNGLISLDHQLIAAKLNILNGASGSAVASAILNSDNLIGGLDVLNHDHLDPSVTGAFDQILDDYNNGVLNGGPAKCPGE